MQESSKHYCQGADLNHDGTPVAFDAYNTYGQLHNSLKWLAVSLLMLKTIDETDPCNECLMRLTKELLRAINLKLLIFTPASLSQLFKTKDADFTNHTFVTNLKHAICNAIKEFTTQHPDVTLDRQGFPHTSMTLFLRFKEAAAREAATETK